MSTFIGRGTIPPKWRKSHTKSRNGCLICKSRRIKCDEDKPSCQNCIRFSASCQYSNMSPTESQSASHIMHSQISQPSSSVTLRGRKPPGRPRKHLHSIAGLDLTASLQPSDHDYTTHREFGESSINLEHMEIFHHFTTSTCNSLSSDLSAKEMLRVQLPQMGIEQPFIMHLIMALSSRHLQYLTSEESKKAQYADIAERQFSAALPKFRQLLPHIDEKNSQALYISSVLVCWYIFARGPSLGEYLLFSDNKQLLWLPLLRGVRHIRELGYQASPLNSVASRLASGELPDAQEPTVNTLHIQRIDWEEKFQEFTAFVASTAPAGCVERYLAALTELQQHYHATYGDDENGSYNGNKISQLIFQWLYLMKEELVEEVQQKKPYALLIVAHFCVLINTYDSSGCWFLHGWSQHILNGIYHSLESNYRSWMRWPMEKVGIDWTTLTQ